MVLIFGSSQATVIGEGVQKYLNLFETPSSDFMRLCKHTCHYLCENVDQETRKVFLNLASE